MNAHPHGEQLSAYLDGMLDVVQMRDVAAHLSACPACRAAYEGLKQTKSLLQGIGAPAPPVPEFWVNAYRRMRVEDAAKRPAFRPSWEALRDAMREPQRRWSAGLAAAAVVAAAIAGPLVGHGPVPPMPPVSPASNAPAADTVDVSSLVQAHTESAARQPLADRDRQDMIAMDDSFTADDSGMSAAANVPDAVSDAAP
ncbi:MAG: zf-HC2 domain-containing protein [Armatimonadetes bacterium]|nr:zf-HC2 domain-containing protein [Armatimonadota bacterium]